MKSFDYLARRYRSTVYVAMLERLSFAAGCGYWTREMDAAAATGQRRFENKETDVTDKQGRRRNL